MSKRSGGARADLQAGGLDVLGGVEALRELGQVDLDVVPAVGQLERQRAGQVPDLRRRRHATGAKTTTHAAVVQHLPSRSSGRAYLRNSRTAHQLNRERESALIDTIGTVPVPRAGHFQC